MHMGEEVKEYRFTELHNYYTAQIVEQSNTNRLICKLRTKRESYMKLKNIRNNYKIKNIIFSKYRIFKYINYKIINYFIKNVYCIISIIFIII